MKHRNPCPRLTDGDRLFWLVLSTMWNGWQSALHNVPAHPTEIWTARQLVEDCGLDYEPKYLLRDRDGIYGAQFSRQAKALDIREVVTAPRSPWQNAYVERVIGSIRRECLDHVIVLGERQLKRVLCEYVDYYNRV